MRYLSLIALSIFAVFVIFHIINQDRLLTKQEEDLERQKDLLNTPEDDLNKDLNNKLSEEES